MSRQSTRVRPPHCSSSSAGSASYQGISGATSPVYHLPQEYHQHQTDFVRKKNVYTPDENLLRDHHNYYNIQKPPCCNNKDSIADTHSYQYLNNDRDDRKSYQVTDTFSEDDSSYYDYQRNFDRDHKFTNNLYSEYESDFPITHQPATSGNKKKHFQKDQQRYQSNRSSSHHHTNNSHLLKENPVLLNQDVRTAGGFDRVYPEGPLTRPVGFEYVQGSLQRRVDINARLSSDRAASPDSVSSAIVDGCGGHCVAFENVCSYVLQMFFIMGILIGVSLCIAGTVLRRTKSRDLQVLVYIGAMSAMVCTLLLVVQCRVRRSLRKRKRAARMTRTATIPLGDININIRPVVHQQQPLINLRTNEDRAVVIQQQQQQQIHQRTQEIIADQQGVPWWRRNDLPGNRV